MTTNNTQSGSDTNVTRKDTPTEVETRSNKGVQAELDWILAKHNGELGVTWEDPDVVTPDTKQAILDWHNKQIDNNTTETLGKALEIWAVSDSDEVFYELLAEEFGGLMPVEEG